MNTGFARPDISKLELGDMVRIPLSFQNGLTLQYGQVVYIHSRRRFFTVEFSAGRNRIRESFCAFGLL